MVFLNLIFFFFFKVDGNSSTLSMNIHFKTLKRLVEEHTFSEILIPLQSVMIPTLPSIPGTHANHDPFPGCWAYIAGFDDVVRLCLTPAFSLHVRQK